jgi:hypothetical protein
MVWAASVAPAVEKIFLGKRLIRRRLQYTKKPQNVLHSALSFLPELNTLLQQCVLGKNLPSLLLNAIWPQRNFQAEPMSCLN